MEQRFGVDRVRAGEMNDIERLNFKTTRWHNPSKRWTRFIQTMTYTDGNIPSVLLNRGV